MRTIFDDIYTHQSNSTFTCAQYPKYFSLFLTASTTKHSFLKLSTPTTPPHPAICHPDGSSFPPLSAPRANHTPAGDECASARHALTPTFPGTTVVDPSSSGGTSHAATSSMKRSSSRRPLVSRSPGLDSRRGWVIVAQDASPNERMKAGARPDESGRWFIGPHRASVSQPRWEIIRPFIWAPVDGKRAHLGKEDAQML